MTTTYSAMRPSKVKPTREQHVDHQRLVDEINAENMEKNITTIYHILRKNRIETVTLYYAGGDKTGDLEDTEFLTKYNEPVSARYIEAHYASITVTPTYSGGYTDQKPLQYTGCMVEKTGTRLDLKTMLDKMFWDSFTTHDNNGIKKQDSRIHFTISKSGRYVKISVGKQSEYEDPNNPIIRFVPHENYREKYLAALDKNIKILKTAMFHEMNAKNIDRIIVEFNGQSNDIEFSATAYDKNDNSIDSDDTKINYERSELEEPYRNTTQDPDKSDDGSTALHANIITRNYTQTVLDACRHLFGDLMEKRNTNWAQRDGANGTITLYRSTETLQLIIHERHTTIKVENL